MRCKFSHILQYVLTHWGIGLTPHTSTLPSLHVSWPKVTSGLLFLRTMKQHCICLSNDELDQLWFGVNAAFLPREHVRGRSWESWFCPSVRVSVTRVDCDKTKWRTADILISHERAITLLLWYRQWLVGDAPSLWNLRSKWPTPPFEKRRLRPISAHNVSTVGDSEKSSITTNTKSITAFPTSHRWSAYVIPKCPKWWLKARFLSFLSKSQLLIVSSAVNLVRRSVS